jgi:hypothetical protein
VTRRGNYGKGVHLEGNGGDRAVVIPRFQGGSPACVDLGPHYFGPDGKL